MANDKKVKKEKKHFLKDFKSELKRVTWPTGKQLVNNTVAVITIVFITAAIVFVLDLGFEMLNKYGINKIKSAVNSKDNQGTTVVENQETTNGQDDNNNVTPSPEAQQ